MVGENKDQHVEGTQKRDGKKDINHMKFGFSGKVDDEGYLRDVSVNEMSWDIGPSNHPLRVFHVMVKSNFVSKRFQHNIFLIMGIYHLDITSMTVHWIMEYVRFTDREDTARNDVVNCPVIEMLRFVNWIGLRCNFKAFSGIMKDHSWCPDLALWQLKHLHVVI